MLNLPKRHFSNHYVTLQNRMARGKKSPRNNEKSQRWKGLSLLRVKAKFYPSIFKTCTGTESHQCSQLRGRTKWQWSLWQINCLKYCMTCYTTPFITFNFQVQPKDGSNYDINTSFLSKWNERTVNPSGHGSSAAEMMSYIKIDLLEQRLRLG